MVGCKNYKAEKKAKKCDIVIGYGWNSFMAVLDDADQIEKLEELFSKSKFEECSETLQHPYLTVQIYKENETKLYHIDKNNTIKLSDDRLVKAKNIDFESLYAIYEEYLDKNNLNSIN